MARYEDANTEVKRQRTLRDEAVDALKQSLRDLESLRIVLSGDKDKLKADIRNTIDRSR